MYKSVQYIPYTGAITLIHVIMSSELYKYVHDDQGLVRYYE